MGLLRRSDVAARLCGAALLALATLVLALLHPHATPRAGDGPTVGEFALALLAVCCGSVGAVFLVVGRSLFAPVSDRRRPPPVEPKVPPSGS